MSNGPRLTKFANSKITLQITTNHLKMSSPTDDTNATPTLTPGQGEQQPPAITQDASPASVDTQQQQPSQATNLATSFEEEQEEQEEVQTPSDKPQNQTQKHPNARLHHRKHHHPPHRKSKSEPKEIEILFKKKEAFICSPQGKNNNIWI